MRGQRYLEFYLDSTLKSDEKPTSGWLQVKVRMQLAMGRIAHIPFPNSEGLCGGSQGKGSGTQQK